MAQYIFERNPRRISLACFVAVLPFETDSLLTLIFRIILRLDRYISSFLKSISRVGYSSGGFGKTSGANEQVVGSYALLSDQARSLLCSREIHESRFRRTTGFLCNLQLQTQLAQALVTASRYWKMQTF